MACIPHWANVFPVELLLMLIVLPRALDATSCVVSRKELLGT